MKPHTLDELREFAKAIFLKAISAVDPRRRLEEMIRVEKNVLSVRAEGGEELVFNLREFRELLIVGAGKAAASMAQAIERIFGDRISRGIITTKYGHSLPLRYTETLEAGHPIPDEQGLEGARKIRNLLRQADAQSLILFLLSGGGSALLPMPVEGITLRDKQMVTQLLLDCGADIREMNTVRKHLSQIKGGGLARWAYPSTLLSFILSDVVGDPLDSIGSGPTVPDPTTFEDAWKIVQKYDLTGKIPASVRERLERGREGRLEETPKPGDPTFERVHNFIIASNIVALEAAAEEARALGFRPLILSSSIVGDTREAARFHAAIAKEIRSSGNPVPRPACLISGGETTVTVRGDGLGGRNQEFALAAALEIQDLDVIVLLSGGTDGTDGPTDAAGALCDHTTVKRASALGLNPRDYLANNDAYPFFKKLGDLLITGPTQTNVMDIRILLVE